MNKKPVIKYEYGGIRAGGIYTIKLFKDGVVQVKGEVLDPGMEEVKEKEKEFQISSEKVREYAKKLIEAGFFDFKDEYGSGSLSSKRWFILNWGKKSKEVYCSGVGPDSETFKEVTEELEELLEEQLSIFP